MDSDEEDFVFYGTPIEREEELTSRKNKAFAEASGHLRSLPPWKQEVRDEEGRRRFHGAFTGGFSSGYYNTVGSKEGWTPLSFTSSRKNRAELKQQNIYNFLDDDEKAELDGRSFGTSSLFDTFGRTGVELARKQAEKEQQKRPSAIPGPVLDELIFPSVESVGVKLLSKMGWRRGRSIGDSRNNSLYDARREARKAFLALSCNDAIEQFAEVESFSGDLEDVEQPANDDIQSLKSTPVYVLHPKQDLYGLGYDPFKHAPEFRERKRSRSSGSRDRSHTKPFLIRDNMFASKSGQAAPGFGIGALEEFDAEDEDVYASGYDFEESYVQEVEDHARLSMDDRPRLSWQEEGALSGFKGASNSDYQLERFDPPAIPKDFVPHHKFHGPIEAEQKLSDPPPPDVSSPKDNNLKVLINGVAALVARCGKIFEDLSKEKNKSNPLFDFLSGGNGHDYYTRKLWEERQKHGYKINLQLDRKLSSSALQLTAESRGKILGERPLESSKDIGLSISTADIHLPLNLSDTFTNPALYSELQENAHPFRDEPAKQERFEQFLKEKYQGGLRSYDSGRGCMSEAARAREKLEFEAAAEAIEKVKRVKNSQPSTQHVTTMLDIGGMQFTSAGVEQPKDAKAEELLMRKAYPKRKEFEWRPAPILCKRFDLIDPYMGKPPPAPRIRSKMDALIVIPDYVKATKVENSVTANKVSYVPQCTTLGTIKDVAEKDIEVKVEPANVERPVDLYKAIFSDSSDDEQEQPVPTQANNPQKKIDTANTTLSRLVAGDFLESLGKELGLEVPPDPFSANRATATGHAFQEETVSPSKQSTGTLPVEREPRLVSGAIDLSRNSHEEGESRGKREVGKMSTRDRSWSSSSSDDERSRKQYRRRKSGDRSSDGYSSGDYRDRNRSRSKGRRKRSSQDKGSSRKHSKHPKDRSRDPRSRFSRHSSDQERSEAKKEKRRK